MLSAQSVSNIRVAMLGLTGLICLAYAVLALTTGRPQPFSPWIPAGFGVGSALIIMIAAALAGDRNAEIASDEGYLDDYHRALRFGYWVAVLLYPTFGGPLYLGWVTPGVALAAMGTLTGAAFLVSFTWLDLKGRM